MKTPRLSQLYRLNIMISVLLFCYNGTMIDSTTQSASTDPDTNFYGIIEDHVKKAQVESILIGGKYESIPVYQDILKSMINKKDNIIDDSIDPKQNKILINLKEVRSITLKHPENIAASTVSINNKKYIQIVITSISGSKKDYLVENSRKITCKEIDIDPEHKDITILQHRDLNFTHIKKLTIQGYKSHNSKITSNSHHIALSKSEKNLLTEEKNKLKHDTSAIINSIEENIKNLPTNNPTAFETMRKTILLLLKSLRDQLQKFLDMVK